MEKRIKRLENALKPTYIFSEKVIEETQEVREDYMALKTKSTDISIVEHFKEVLDRIKHINIAAERERQRSALSFLWKALQIGIMTSLASITIMFYFMPPSIYVVPLPFVFAIGTALSGYVVVRKYPYIKKRHFMLIAQIFAQAILGLMAIWIMGLFYFPSFLFHKLCYKCIKTR